MLSENVDMQTNWKRLLQKNNTKNGRIEGAGRGASPLRDEIAGIRQGVMICSCRR